MSDLSSQLAHHKVSISTLKGLAESSRSHSSRFVIDKNGVWHGGDAEFWTHSDLLYEDDCDYSLYGYIYYEKDHFTFSLEPSRSNEYLDPIAKRCELYGITERPLDEHGRIVFPSNDELGILEDHSKW